MWRGKKYYRYRAGLCAGLLLHFNKDKKMSNVLQPNSIPSADGLAQNPLLAEDMGGLVVLSLFNGMSCGEIALHVAGVKIKQYYSAEIDKSAIWVTQNNYPNTIQLGDVTKVFAKDLPKIDLIIGGSPCQGFSFAGKGLNFEDPRSKLFFEFVRLVNECKPKYFLLENVKMKKEHELVISQYMKVAPIEINSALVSAQNRVRLYWTNIAQKPYGLFGDMFTDIPQPKDRGILLKDILETDVPGKYFLSDKMLAWLNTRDKQAVDINGKSGCFTAGGNSGGLHSQMDLIKCVAMRGREAVLTPKRTEYGKAIRKDYEAGNIKEQRKNVQQLEPREDGKTNCLTSVQKDNLVLVDFAHKNEGLRFYDDKSPTLRQRDYKEPRCFSDGNLIRRLTPTECERLQTVPDGFTKGVSDTQRYRMLGNGWTVDVIAYIFGFMKQELSKSAEW